MRLAWIAIFFCFSCTTIHYKSEDDLPIYISPKIGHNYQVIIEGEKKFYLWGMAPSEHEVKLDALIESKGIFSAANIKIKEYQSWENKLLSFISFGMLIPINYQVIGFGQKVDN